MQTFECLIISSLGGFVGELKLLHTAVGGNWHREIKWQCGAAIKIQRTGNSLGLQWLGLGAFTLPWPVVQSLVGELRSLKLHSMAKKKKKYEVQMPHDPVILWSIFLRKVLMHFYKTWNWIFIEEIKQKQKNF